MNNAQDMSPDFVLMRLVSAAEDDRLDEENGNLSSGGVVAGLGKEVLAHSNMKGGLEFARDPTTGLAHSGNLSSLNNAQQSGGTAAPDSGVMATKPSVSIPPPHSAMEAKGFEFAHRGGLRPQLLVFPNILRDGEGILECESDGRNQSRKHIGLDKTSGSVSDLTGGINNNTLSAGDAQQQNHLSQSWGLHPRVVLSTVAADIEGGELCHRHSLITNPSDWPPLRDKSNPFTMIESKWGCTTGELPDGPVFDLARRFGELGLGAVPKILFKDGAMPQCSCQGAHGPAPAGMGHGDDPTETSDALLVLEGLGTGDVARLGITGCPEDDSDESRARRVQKMSGAFSLSSFQAELTRQMEGVAGEPCPSAHGDAQVCSLHGNVPNPTQPIPGDTEQNPEVSTLPGASAATPSSDRPVSPTPSQASTPRKRADKCVSEPRTPTGRVEKTLKVPGKSRKGSLKIRLSKLFRTKSCSGSNSLLDKRPSVAYSISSAGSLVDMASGSGGEHDVDSQPQMTRAQSAFSPASFAPFTGETVSLVDVDISRRGANTPHPPTPPPPPRRSLSLLDAFLRALPHSTSSQLLSAPPPSRLAPPPRLCPLRRAEASNFTASLRELEKCGWYWGPMNWEDAEMKLKGKPDGAFLVRDSSDPRYILSLSFRSQGVTHHTRMEHYRGTFSLWCHPKFEDRCHSVVEFIERAIMHSKNGKFLYFLRSRVPGLPPTPVQLLYPVSRFSNVKSLQHLCRFCIRQMVRIDHIQELPLPKPLIMYLRKFYYYDAEEEMYLSIKSIRPGAGVEKEAESQT
ncbi:suppressor of cytokine signaling 7-like isoform X2 [Oncorhynchus keta]|uniref:suppressor of cytokine signaling 7-like isoform X2 n=1 Tax=Oncorhynchus keta TaxID=8018 RepID=UPI00227CA7A9|nr:suppressor of cytokine signaling 7-like isoform X2 [Oncorhynchus keta]